MDNKKMKPHAIMVPLPLQGHVRPLAHLAMKLASIGFAITFVNMEHVHHQLTKATQNLDSTDDDMFAEARKSGLDIRYKTISDGLPLGFDRILNLEQNIQATIHVLSAHVDDLLNKIAHLDPPVNCLIADTFHVWPSMIARRYNLVCVSFWTQPALVLDIYYHMDLLRINGHYASKDNRKDTIDYIPGIPAIERKDLTSHFQENDTISAFHELLAKAFRDVKNVDMIICNTVQELEVEAVAAMQAHKPVYAIGPVFPGSYTSNGSVSTSLWSEVDCIQWLNNKPKGSVIYISFGSFCNVSREELMELARGLLLSQVNFIWVFRVSTSLVEAGPLPAGFEDEIKGRGLIVPWCSQTDVLSHPAVGGFLTHCGWNSVLESMWYGVPMLCLPLSSDQFTNRKLVVDDWRIGVNLCDKSPVRRNEVAKRINHIMFGHSSDEISNKTREIKVLLENALDSGGSSHKNFRNFIKNLEDAIQKKKKIVLRVDRPIDFELPLQITY